jgi:hypothetical protein
MPVVVRPDLGGVIVISCCTCVHVSFFVFGPVHYLHVLHLRGADVGRNGRSNACIALAVGGLLVFGAVVVREGHSLGRLMASFSLRR